MKSVVVLNSKNIEEYKKCGTNHFLLPLVDFSVSYPVVYSVFDISKLKEENPDSKFFVILNKMIFNHEIEKLKQILQELENLSIEGIFFYDMAVLKLQKSLSLETPFIWNNTHMVTNSKTLNYLMKQNVWASVISGELEQSEIISLLKNTKMPLFYSLVSHPVVAYSKRKLLTHYSKASGRKKREFLTIHEKVSNQDYFVREEKEGVSFFSSMIPNHYTILKELDVSYVILNESYIEHELFMKLLNITNQYLRREILFDEMICYVETQIGMDAPFLNHKTIYQVKKEGK